MKHSQKYPSQKHTSLRAKPHSEHTQVSSEERITPRKELGQNFLRDGNIARNIVRALDAQPQDTIIEVGPGEGALTQLLLETQITRCIAVEFDKRAVEMLGAKFSQEMSSSRLHIVHSDILKTSIAGLLQDSGNQRTKLIGNIPYYITSDILFWLFDEWARMLIAGSQAPERAVIMMQKEVAERIVAKQRTKDYGILSVASLLVSEPKILFHVSPSCFFPPPKVTSSVVEFRMKSRMEDAVAFRETQPLVRAAFNQRRKMLSNALHSTLLKVCAAYKAASTIADTELTPTQIIALAEERGMAYFRKRAEELLPNDFIALAAFLRDVTSAKTPFSQS